MISVLRSAAPVNAFSRSCQVQKNDVGSLSFQILRDDTGAVNLGVTGERIEVTLTDDLSGSEQTMMIGRVGPWSQVHDDRGEEAAQTYSVSLPGTLSYLADAMVYPRVDAGLFQSKADTRFFNFASPDWDGWLSWPAATALYQQGNPATSYYGVTIPKDWPDPLAYWIWSRPLDPTALSSAGTAYFRTEIETEAGNHAIYITADDSWRLYIDGEPVDEHYTYGDWEKTFAVTHEFNAGTHTIGVFCTNLQGYVAGLICSIFKTGSDQVLETLVAHTDASWSTLSYPTSPPGMTPGEIMKVIFDEALARGTLTIGGTAWSYDFTETDDSLGNAWTEPIEMTMKIGESVLDAVRKMAETWVDIRVDMATQTFQMVNKGTFNTNPAINLLEGVHLSGLTMDGSAPQRSIVLAHDADGNYTEVDSQVDGDRVESLLEASSAPTPDAAGKIAAGALIATAPGPVTVQAVVESIAGSVPMKDFNVFDVIKMPNANGDATNTEVVAITAADVQDNEDGGGWTVYVVQGVQGRLLVGQIDTSEGGSGLGSISTPGVIDPVAPPTDGPGGSNVLLNLDF